MRRGSGVIPSWFADAGAQQLQAARPWAWKPGHAQLAGCSLALCVSRLPFTGPRKARSIVEPQMGVLAASTCICADLCSSATRSRQRNLRAPPSGLVTGRRTGSCVRVDGSIFDIHLILPLKHLGATD